MNPNSIVRSICELRNRYRVSSECANEPLFESIQKIAKDFIESDRICCEIRQKMHGAMVYAYSDIGEFIKNSSQEMGLKCNSDCYDCNCVIESDELAIAARCHYFAETNLAAICEIITDRIRNRLLRADEKKIFVESFMSLYRAGGLPNHRLSIRGFEFYILRNSKSAKPSDKIFEILNIDSRKNCPSILDVSVDFETLAIYQAYNIASCLEIAEIFIGIRNSDPLEFADKMKGYLKNRVQFCQSSSSHVDCDSDNDIGQPLFDHISARYRTAA